MIPVILSVILLSSAAQAETFVRGRVLDATGAGIPAAHVKAGSWTAVTNADGNYAIPLPPAQYTITAVKAGFLENCRIVDIVAEDVTDADITLQVAPVRGAITVSESAGYLAPSSSTATRTLTPLRDVPQSVAVVTHEQIRDQLMTSIGDVVRYIPGITAVQGENNRDQVVIRGNNSTADFFINGIRDDVQYFRDLYNLDRVEALKGPNAMIFGRGGGGGVINRVTKEAGFTPIREVTLQGGSFNNKRFLSDFDQPLSQKAALRFNALYENSGHFRDGVNIERYGLNPTLTLLASARTRIVLGYEHFYDSRIADRGIPSFFGRPADAPISRFFGNPDESPSRARVNLGMATVEHQRGRLNLRNRSLLGDYDKYYQNFVPGALNAAQTLVAISSYNSATQRRNFFNQTDITYGLSTGPIRHMLLWGLEAGRQSTSNLRNTAYFNNATSILVPYSNPAISSPVSYRQSATDANNNVRTNVGATFLQDQIELSRYVQVIAGVRIDHFDLNFHNNRTDESLRRIDNLLSPRAGIVFKPASLLSLYGNYSVSYLPSSGDQFASLTTITQQVKPEKFTNYELGLKWDVHRYLSLTTAVYRLNRTNTRATDPNDPTRILQTGSQRTNGYEVGMNGTVTRSWKIAGGYAYQDAFITSATTAALAGAQVAQVPHHTFSFWNSYQFVPRVGAGIGILNRADMFAAIDNTVTLPGYTRADAALYVFLNEKVRVQANVENLTNKRYYLNADGNNNIAPGFSRAVRIGITARF